MAEMVKAILTGTYGYRDPVTGQRKYYGPGVDIPVPVGLAQTLGLVSAPLEATPTELVQGAEVEIPKEPTDLLPDNFPGRKFLVEAGYTTLGNVASLSIDDLIEINGIGTRLAEKILERTRL